MIETNLEMTKAFRY